MELIKKMINKYNEKNFMKSILIYIISVFCNSVIPFLLLPFLTRYLQPKEYGMINMFNAFVSFISPFVCMGANSAIQRNLIDEKKDGRIYVFNCFIVIIVAGLLTFFLIFFKYDIIFKIIGIQKKYSLYAFILVFSNIVFDITLVVFQMKKKVKKFFIYQNMCTLLNISLSIFMIIYLELGLKGRIYGIVFSKFLFAIYGVYIILKKEIGLKLKVNKKYIEDCIFNYGFPLIPTSLKVTALTFVDKLFITNMISVSETGIYSVGNQFSLPILLLAQAFNLAYVPWLYNKLKEKKDRIKIIKLTYLYFVLIVVIAICWSFISPSMIRLISGMEYYSAIKYVFWLSIGYSFTGMHMMVVNYIYYYKRTVIYSFITIIVILLNLLLNYIFINKHGAVGAAQATAIVNFISFILTWCLVIKVCDMPWFNIKE